MLTIKILSPEDLVPLCNQVICRSSGSGIITLLVFPQFQNCSDIMRNAPPLQRRVRAGFSPASLLAFTVVKEHQPYLVPLRYLINTLLVCQGYSGAQLSCFYSLCCSIPCAIDLLAVHVSISTNLVIVLPACL